MCWFIPLDREGPDTRRMPRSCSGFDDLEPARWCRHCREYVTPDEYAEIHWQHDINYD